MSGPEDLFSLKAWGSFGGGPRSRVEERAIGFPKRGARELGYRYWDKINNFGLM